MDYTTLVSVKLVKDAQSVTDDTLMSKLITEASRTIDRYCAGGNLKSDNYFAFETITDELITGQVDSNGRIICRPRKPFVASISSFSYRSTPSSPWTTVDPAMIDISGYTVAAWAGLATRGNVTVKATYSGGLSASTAGLPADIINAADLLAVRFYMEIKSGLADSIGVAETGMMMYTKALPIRLVEMLKPYKRVIV